MTRTEPLAGASVLGIGALAFYGLGLSNKEGAADKAMLWPEHVRQRVRDTYGYFGASIGITAASAAAVFRYFRFFLIFWIPLEFFFVRFSFTCG